MVIIDPLRLKIQENLEKGIVNPLNSARLGYGTEKDLNELINTLGTIKTHKRKYIFIDLTPFERIGRVDEFVEKIGSIDYIQPVIMIISDSLMAAIMRKTKSSSIVIAKFNADGFLNEISFGSKKNETLKDAIYKDLKQNQSMPDLALFRRIITRQNLIRLLYNTHCLEIPRHTDPQDTREEICGRYYRIMPNNMLVSCYLNLKQIGNDYQSLTKLAYEIVLEICQFFLRDVDALNQFDVLVAPNNTSLFLASTVQAIIGKPIICVDKLGPIPALNLNSDILSKYLEEKRVILIEEVTATGNEIDRDVFFLNNIKATIHKIIAIYNLEVGMPMLIDNEQIISLCKPKKELKYEYRSR